MSNQESAATLAGDNRPANWPNLLAQAREAEARYDHETAVTTYTAALELPDLTPAEQYEVRSGRAFATYNWGIPDQISAEANNVIALARQLDDKRLLAEAIAVHGFFWRSRGVDDPPLEMAQEGLLLANAFDEDRLRGYCRLILAMEAWTTGDPDSAWDHLRQALEAARRSGDDEILFEVIRLNAYSHESFGRTDVALRLLAELLSLAEKSGSEFKRYQTMLLYGNTVRDLAAKRDYYEQALHAETASGYRIGASTNSIAVLYWRLGLYNRAQDYAAAAAHRAEAAGLPYRIDNAADSIGRILLAKGLFDEAEGVLRKVTENPKSNFHKKAEVTIGLAEIALARRRPSAAVDLFYKAPDLHKSVEPAALAGLGAAYLAMNQIEEALAHANGSIAFLEAGLSSSEFHEQEIWWRYYQVLNAAAVEDPFPALDNARQTMLAAIETLSDEGLRRNYLNKVGVNRDITLTWTAEAVKRGIPLDPFTQHEPLTGHLRAQFRRVVDIGARLTAQHDPQTLAEFIVEEFVEMSGAERVLLLAEGAHGEITVAASFNPGDAAEMATPLLQTMRYTRQPLMRDDMGEVPEGEVPEIEQRSFVALPLVASDRFLGLLYGDVRQIFGRFNDADLQLLGMLANQAAAALENAALVSTLEEKVEERTAALQSANENLAARNDELAIINVVQHSLAAELELQSIFNIVGDKLSEIYGTDSIALWMYDKQTDTAFPRYYKESGTLAKVEPQAPGPIGRLLMQTHEPLLLRTKSDYSGLGHIQPAGTVPPQSGMFVPLIAGSEFIGILYLFSFKPAAFDESDLRLLTTLASSMSVTLDNARLFNDAKEARAEAEQANAAKSAFMSNMSHELRTPLNAILGFTRIVKRKAKGALPERQIDNLGKVLSSGEHLLGLINTVLDIAKIEAGRMDVINSRFHIGQLIETTATVAQPLLKMGVDLQLNIAPGIPEINSDQDKIKQILLNLLSNAAKFTHEGAITVSVNMRAVHEPPLLEIEVSDTGIGMNEAALGRVFEEFQQADATTRKEYGGTGLGMPISKHLAQLLGGDLTVTSSVGEGSTFTLTLPVEAVVS